MNTKHRHSIHNIKHYTITFIYLSPLGHSQVLFHLSTKYPLCYLLELTLHVHINFLTSTFTLHYMHYPFVRTQSTGTQVFPLPHRRKLYLIISSKQSSNFLKFRVKINEKKSSILHQGHVSAQVYSTQIKYKAKVQFCSLSPCPREGDIKHLSRRCQKL